MKTKNKIDIKGLLGVISIIVIALLAMWDTTNMVDADSYLFPRAILLIMLFLCVLFIFLQFFSPPPSPEEDEKKEQGLSSIRPILLIVSMLIGAMLMPVLGFGLAGLIVFAALMFVSKYEPWSTRKKIVLLFIGIMIVLGFYYVFSKILLVPLPEGEIMGKIIDF